MKFQAPISVAIAIAFGLIVLLGYFINIPILSAFRNVFVQWALMLAAVALLVGVANIFIVHWRKASRREKGASSSIILIISLLITLVVAGYFGPTGSWTMWIFNYIQVPLESSLMALLAIVLVYAGAKLFSRRVNLFTLIFIGTALVMLLGTAPLFGIELPGIHGSNGIKNLISQIPAVAGARGILLGVALGTIATGLRIFLGADRPYGG
ncbi:MAG: hypothetical protein KAS38_06960 [Anaerolineales bacterium]|nr:hypothetical protein [Anaerolineales bacterium]